MSNDPMKEWVLRDEILASAHRWPMIVIFAIAGALLAMLAVYVWPAPYQANLELSVELNPYRVLDDQYLTAFTNAEFRNIDDYKHWQMMQLTILVLSDPYMTETLNRLRQIDAYWNSVNEQELRTMLAANWRNAGVWLLSATSDTGAKAAEAVEIWRDVVIDLATESITNSQSLFQIELKLRALNELLVQNQLAFAGLEDLQRTILGYQDELGKLDQDAILPTEYHQEMLNIRIQLAEILPGKIEEEDIFPELNAPVREYTAWLDLIDVNIGEQILAFNKKQNILTQEISDVTSLWKAGLENAQGLSATLNLAKRSGDPPVVKQSKSYGLAAVIGVILGLLSLIGVFLFLITRKAYK
jgi:hypothetical protein